MRLLDCTLRDGGYYTSWHFPKHRVQQYLNAAAAAGVDAIEVGLRRPPASTFLGAHAYTTDSYLRDLDLPEAVIGVMVDAKALLTYPTLDEAVGALFSPAAESPVSLVRIATHFADVAAMGDAAQRLSGLGYRVGFNLMQAAGKPDDLLAESASVVGSWDAVEVLYFADSFGGMDASEVCRITDAIRQGWSGDIGFHAHNNRSLALSNALAARAGGVGWIDGTLLGMGRGAGNAATEQLCLELERLGEAYRSVPLWTLLLEYFLPLQREYGWGSNFLYHFAADRNVHPTFVQSLLMGADVDAESVVHALRDIATRDAASFSEETLSKGRSAAVHMSGDGDWDATRWCDGRNLLIVGAGPSVAQHRDGLRRFIERHNPITISVNLQDALGADCFDAYAAVHPLKVGLEATEYAARRRPLFTPLSSLGPETTLALKGTELRNYGIRVTDRFAARSTSCDVPALLTLPYVLALANIGGARQVFLSGFDGFAPGDPRQEEMVATLRAVLDGGAPFEIRSLTPTSYPIIRDSVYAPR